MKTHIPAAGFARLRALLSWPQSHFPFLVILLAASVLVALPLFQGQQMKGHDTFAYLPRLEEFYQQLNSGIFFPRWAPDFSAGYGQPFFIFNPPIIYYIAAGFHFFQLSFVVSENLTFFVLLLLAGCGMYVLANEFFGKHGAVTAGVAYLCGPYLLVNIYVRHALADFSAFAFLPLAWWGVYKFCQTGRYRYIVAGAASLAGLMLSANTIALIAFPALGVFLLAYAWLQQSNQRWVVLQRGAWCIALGLALAAMFWVPALFERSLVQTERLITGKFNFKDHFVYPEQLVYSKWGYGSSNPGPVDGMSFELGYVQLACSVAALSLWKRLAGTSRPAGLAVGFFLTLMAVSAFFSSGASLFIWNRLLLLQYFQFPWRFLSLAALAAAFICGFPFLLLKDRHGRLTNALLLVLLSALFFQSYGRTTPSGYTAARDENYTPRRIASDNISVNTFNEYETIWMTAHPKQPAAERVTITAGAGQISALQIDPTHVSFRADISASATMRVNTAYFPGWVLRVDGQPAPLAYDNPEGVMEFQIAPGNHVINLQFEDAPIQQLSNWISIFSLVLLTILPRLPRRITKISR